MAEVRPRALVTGASAGIGAAFAERLAGNGYDLIVVARREDRLRDLASRLHHEHGATVQVAALDLSDRSALWSLKERVTGRQDVLVNNAGFGAYMPFVELPDVVAQQLVDVHVTSTTLLTRWALPGMIDRGRGAVINVASMLAFSSTVGEGPQPPRVVYASCKAFVVAFSELLSHEVEGTGVKVQALCPGIVRTEFHEVQGRDLSHLQRMEPSAVVDASLRGLELGEVVVAPSVEDPDAIEAVARTQRALMGTVTSGLASRYLA
jgi:uncharacterized protein